MTSERVIRERTGTTSSVPDPNRPTSREIADREIERLGSADRLRDPIRLESVEIIGESEKAIELRSYPRWVSDRGRTRWFPKSVLGFTPDPQFGPSIVVATWFVARHNLWDF